jgi:hypothetical protein
VNPAPPDAQVRHRDRILTRFFVSPLPISLRSPCLVFASVTTLMP